MLLFWVFISLLHVILGVVLFEYYEQVGEWVAKPKSPLWFYVRACILTGTIGAILFAYFILKDKFNE